VSTGMGTMEEVHAAYEAMRKIDTDLPVVFLHCTSAYPAAVEDVNLRAMQSMDQRLPVLVGYSDHTTLPETPALAVAAGASVIEKHFTVDSTLPGPDHGTSLEPTELSRSVAMVEMAAKALGNSEKSPVDSEIENQTVSRKSLHAATDLEAGTTLSESHIKIARPADGLSPREYIEILGKTLENSLSDGEPITTEDLKSA